VSGRRIQLTTRVEEFFREHTLGRRRLLALTYEFNPAAFERAFAVVLRQAVQVDVIAGTDCEGATTRARYWRANWPRTFHPKLVCLLARDQVCVGIGSANLTSSGMNEQLEAWAWFEPDADGAALAGVRRFLRALDERRVFPQEAQVGEVIEALPELPDHCSLLSVLDGPLLPQVVRRLTKPVRRIDIISPVNGDPSGLVRRMSKLSGTTEINLYTGGQTVPRVGGVAHHHELVGPESDEADKSQRVVSVVHAKLFAFYHGKSVDLFWGSANLSHSAWMAAWQKPNIEILIHTRIRADRWISLRDRALPPGHRWVRCEPKHKAQPAPAERAADSWRLLHAVVDRGRLRLEASDSRKVDGLELRAESRLAKVIVDLSFRDAAALIPRPWAAKLGCIGDQAPRWLLWRLGPASPWGKVPVNRLEAAANVQGSWALAQQLHWEYSGRQLPGTPKNSAPTDSDELAGVVELSDDERELTASDHQGELDRFVLVWRTIARRVAQASGGNIGLRRFHVQDVLSRVRKEADAEPEQWPAYRFDFVRKLLEQPWPK
jgi:hypothetical protein